MSGYRMATAQHPHGEMITDLIFGVRYKYTHRILAIRNPGELTMTPKTNLLFLLTDDQGYWAMGCAGNPEIRTPNLDRLAETGLRFDNFFCASPVGVSDVLRNNQNRVPSG